jgi:stage V sporulation protein B
MKQSLLLKNAAILFAALIITKLIGAVLRIPLTNILGGLGMGYFSTAYSLFSPVYAVTVAALPTVIMRLTAQHSACAGNLTAENTAAILNIRRAGLLIAITLGSIGTAAILVIAAPFSRYVADDPSALPALLVIAPALLISSVSAIYRGYYEGLSNMMPTAISQIIEAVVKSAVGIFLALALLEHSIAYAAAGAIAGITVAEFFGLAFLVLRSRRCGNSLPKSRDSLPLRHIIKRIMKESMPITVAALAMNLNPFIDLITIPRITDQFVYGSYTGIAIPIFAIATTVTAMIGRSAFPEITAAWENQDLRRLTKTLRILFKGTFMVGLPICLGLASLAFPILALLYPARPAEVMVSELPLIILGLGGISLILAGTLFGIFLAIGRVDLQIKMMLAGAAVKLVGNLVFIPNQDLGVSGAAISTVACYTLVSIIGLISLKRLVSDHLTITRSIAQPLVFAIMCAITANVCYYYAFFDRPSLLRLSMSIAAGALAYLLPTMFSDRKYLKNLLQSQ